ncbi:MAG: tetratricopeptide repeat protein [Anaerolineales bacterium]|nr:tetratricopeptide repeat protein [Anaerolineales bacterium]
MAEEYKEEQPNDTIFQDAVEALRRGDKPRAKDLITRLLKTNQNNPTYWIWLSASVDNTKERIYCLQTALKLDPENGTAKRGLILLGALAPDETIQPFPMNRPRAWEDKLLLANEKPKEKGFRVIAKSPVVRLIGMMVIGAGLVSVLIFGFVLPNQNRVAPTTTNTPGPSPTFTATPTLFGATAEPTRVFIGPTPLWMLVPQTYTPTAVYVNTPRVPEAKDQYRLAEDAYKKGDWDGYIASMQMILVYEPNAADIHYLIGEAYRFKGDTANALASYKDAEDIDPNFSAPYLGEARVRLLRDPGYNAQKLLDKAVELDPDYGEAYLERAKYLILRKKAEAAIVDLNRAAALMPNSPDVYLTFANAYLALGEDASALESAEKAYSMDITSLPVYEMLGRLYLENGQYQRSVETLEVYLVYEPEDAAALARLGQAYYEIGEYESAVKALDRATTINRTGLRKYLLYRGLAHLELGDDIEQAVEDLEAGKDADDESYNANLALLRGYFAAEKYGSAFLQVEALKSLAETDEETAIMLYWRGLVQEKREEPKDAIKAWEALLEMDEDVMTPEMRKEAQAHLSKLVPATATATQWTSTPAPKKSATPTPAKGVTKTVTPAKTPTP